MLDTVVKERVQKILSRAGVASRRAAERLMLEGRVEVDGEVVTELGTTADPDIQDIRVDGARVRAHRPRRYLILNKPRGYVTTRSDPGKRPKVTDLLPLAYRSLYPVGRLDIASTGLLVMTDDGELAQELAHPRYGVSKTYLVTVAGAPDRDVLQRACRGIVVDGERLRVDRASIVGSPKERRYGFESGKSRSRLRVTLRQGRNREIRRLFQALGFPVLELHREKIGNLSVRGLPPGGFRRLTPLEVEKLRERPNEARSEGRPRRRRASRR